MTPLRLLHPVNIPSDDVTFATSNKPVTSILVNEPQPENIADMSVTFRVSNVLKSSFVMVEQPLNISAMSVHSSVLRYSILLMADSDASPLSQAWHDSGRASLNDSSNVTTSMSVFSFQPGSVLPVFSSYAVCPSAFLFLLPYLNVRLFASLL